MDKKELDQLVEKWSGEDAGKLSIASIQSEDVKHNMAVLLENQTKSEAYTSLFNEAVNTTTGIGGSNAQFQPIALALVRRTFPALFANKIVAVQAMSGPVGLAYALRFKYHDAYGHEMGFQEVAKYSGFTGSTAGTSGTADAGTSVATATAEAWAISANTYPQGKLVIDQTAITAKTRKLAATFSLEAAQDLRAMHSIDIEREMVNVLQYEIQAEIDREILAKCKAAAINVANGGAAAVSFDVSASDGRWSQEKYSNVVNQIIKVANDIRVSTRRGAGNFVVVSPRVASALQAAAPAFTAISSNVDLTSNDFTNVGTIHKMIAVYVDSYATSDYALVGYKGPGISDAGVIYSPYVTGLVSRAIDPNNFEPALGVMSRQAFTDNLLGSGRYYRQINFSNLDAVLGS